MPMSDDTSHQERVPLRPVFSGRRQPAMKLVQVWVPDLGSTRSDASTPEQASDDAEATAFCDAALRAVAGWE